MSLSSHMNLNQPLTHTFKLIMSVPLEEQKLSLKRMKQQFNVLWSKHHISLS